MASTGGRGRKGGVEKARELVAVVGSLAKAGDRISADTIASRLGVSNREVRRLMVLLLSATSGSDDYLSLYAEDDGFDELVVTQNPSLTGKPLRLTYLESLALNSALSEAGVPADDPLRGALSSSFGAQGLDLDSVMRIIEPGGDPMVAKNLAWCGRAIARGLTLRFDYVGIVSNKRTRRHVACQSPRFDGEYVYLDAFDLDAGAGRTFRLDRMSNPELGEALPTPPAAKAPSRDGSREIRLVFHDKSALGRFFWPGLELDEEDDVAASGTIPYFGGTWLPRRIAACGKDVETTDPEVAALVTKIASDLLAMAEEAGI